MYCIQRIEWQHSLGKRKRLIEGKQCQLLKPSKSKVSSDMSFVYSADSFLCRDLPFDSKRYLKSNNSCSGSLQSHNKKAVFTLRMIPRDVVDNFGAKLCRWDCDKKGTLSCGNVFARKQRVGLESGNCLTWPDSVIQNHLFADNVKHLLVLIVADLGGWVVALESESSLKHSTKLQTRAPEFEIVNNCLHSRGFVECHVSCNKNLFKFY